MAVFATQPILYQWIIDFHVYVTENGIRTHADITATSNANAAVRGGRSKTTASGSPDHC
jgi:hypothetical protein